MFVPVSTRLVRLARRVDKTMPLLSRALADDSSFVYPAPSFLPSFLLPLDFHISWYYCYCLYI